MDDPIVAAEWTGSHAVTLYHTSIPNEEPPDFTPAHGLLQQCKINGMSWNMHTRKFVHQCHGHFMKLQEEVRQQKHAGGAVSGEALLHYSRLYRSTLHECVLGLTQPDHSSRVWEGDAVETEEREELAAYYAMQELAWHLCEVLFIELLPAGCLIQQLLEWIQRNTRSVDEKCGELLTTPTPEYDDTYWLLVYRLTLRGQLLDVAKLLLQHSGVRDNPRAFSSMEEVLLGAPMLASTANLTRADLHRRWADWKKEVSRRKNTGDYMCCTQLELLARILCGEEAAFTQPEIIDSCDSWYELMVGKLLFTNPLVTNMDFDLSYCAEWSANEWMRASEEWERGTLDRVLDAALRNDFMEVISLTSSEFMDWWFVAHISNLLQHKGLLTQQKLESAPRLCEFMLVEYGTSVMSLESMWQVAMDYLSHCPTHGQHYMQLLVERIPLTSERKADKVIHLCQHYHLKEQVRDICKVLAMRAYKNGRLGTALRWCIRGKDSPFSAFLVEKYMESFDSLGEFMDLDLLDHLGDAMLLNDRLLFLAKYREYHTFHNKRELVKAGDLLVSLLVSDSVPHKFISTLLKDALGLLHEETLVFSSEQTYILSDFVLKLTMTPTFDPTTETTEAQVAAAIEKELVSLLRQALVKNLSRALMEECN